MSANPRKRPDAEARAALCQDLQGHHREREWFLGCRNAVFSRLQAAVAGTIGYGAELSEGQRKKLYGEAAKLIKRVVKGEAHPMQKRICLTMEALKCFEVNGLMDQERYMLALAAQLPVAAWVEQPEQRGLGLLGLAMIVGEAGDLANYANPGKLWKRFGLAPFAHKGQKRAPSTLRRLKLEPDVGWTKLGYSPKRRAVAYRVSDALLKGNGDGPYRERYLEAKARAFPKHPEWNWTRCKSCKGRRRKKPCRRCGGTGKKCMQAHRHGLGMAMKRLLLNLWIEWNK